MEKQLVVFELAKEHFGVDIGAVESIIKMQEITVVPQAPSFVEGITNLRGSVLPVIDLRRRFAIAEKDATRESRIVVIAIDQIKVGMVVDSVSEVLRINDDVIEPPPPMVSTVNTTFITGIAKVDNRLVILLDLGRVLNTGELTELSSAAALAA